MYALQKVRYQANYIAQAQKLDKHIKQFDSDPNTQIRWDWELIQNAKDAPNVFKQTHIKQQLQDKYFTSMHNGDAFLINQLHSVVAQYSTKKQKNSQQTKTTGKYGTGFITTYILSRVIQLTGILKVQIAEDSSDQEYQKNQELTKDQHKKFKMQKKMKQLENQLNQLSTEDKQIFNKINNKKKYKKQQQKNYYYKCFNIPMDRSYQDRDQQLPKKIQKTQKRLTKLCTQADYQSQNNPEFTIRDYYQTKRTVNSFDTVFRYKLQNQTKHTMIQQTILNVKHLVPYSFLFNDNLHHYEFIDKRQKHKNISFSLTKGDIIPIGQNIYLFSYEVRQNYDHKQQQFKTKEIAYIISYFYQGKAIASIPVQINENVIKILKVNDAFPKVFKDFPLIGCYDINWNAIINSRQFYPDQKRAKLMLTYFDQTNQSKVQTNWKYINTCFWAIKQLYIFLSKYCILGLERLLIFNDQIDQMTKVKPQFANHLKKMINEIVKTKFIPTRACIGDIKITIQPINLVFIQISNQIPNSNYKSTHYKFSQKANDIFSFIYGKENTILSNFYSDFYQILYSGSPYRKYLQTNKFIKFVDLNQCLKDFQYMQFKTFEKRIQIPYTQKLHQIYKFLSEYKNTEYLSFHSKHDFGIFINQNSQFKSLIKDSMRLCDIPQVYQQLSKILNINIKANLVKEQFVKYIKQNDRKYYFDIAKMQELIYVQMQRRFNKKLNNPQIFNDINHLQTLYLILVLFNALPDNLIIMLRKISIFANLKNFQLKNINQLKPLTKQVSNKLIQLFKIKFAYYFQYLISSNPNFQSFLGNHFLIKYYQQQLDFLKNLYINPIVGTQLGKINYKLCWNNMFVNIKKQNIYKLDANIQYPTQQDIKILNLFGNISVTRVISNVLYDSTINFKSVYDLLVHPINLSIHLNQVKQLTYSDIFSYGKSYYLYLNPTNKNIVLNYINNIYRQYTMGAKITATLQQKYQAFQKLIIERNLNMYELRKQQKKFQSQSTKNFLFDIFSNQYQLECAIQLYENNNSSLYFQQLCQQLGIQTKQKQKMNIQAKK